MRGTRRIQRTTRFGTVNGTILLTSRCHTVFTHRYVNLVEIRTGVQASKREKLLVCLRLCKAAAVYKYIPRILELSRGDVRHHPREILRRSRDEETKVGRAGWRGNSTFEKRVSRIKGGEKKIGNNAEGNDFGVVSASHIPSSSGLFVALAAMLQHAATATYHAFSMHCPSSRELPPSWKLYRRDITATTRY